MGTTQPIRQKDELQKFLDYYQNVHPAPRNEALIVLGLHTALRISDILTLHWGDVYDFNQNCYVNHLFVQEKKTGKQNIIALNIHVKKLWHNYKKNGRISAPPITFLPNAPTTLHL